jgi:hypothetical protein
MVETDQEAAAVRCCAEEASKYEKESLEALAFLGSEVVRTGMRGSDAWPPAAREWHERASEILRS